LRVAIATVQVPFITGGAEIHAASLQRELRGCGHEADIVSIPFKWYPPERLLDCMLMARLMDLTEVNGQAIDRVIALKYPAYYLDHPTKVCWVLHQHRQAYELFGTPYGDLHHDETGIRVAEEIRRWDNALLPKSRAVYANSRTVAERLRRFNSIDAQPLYHPPKDHDRYRCEAFEDFVLYPGRFDPMKRQHLLVEALAASRTPIKAVFIGSMTGEYAEQVQRAISERGLEKRVTCLGLVDEATKLDLYGRCLAVYNGVYEEDYGYLTLEGFFASKPVITHTDSGGPLEFVRSGENGFITSTDAGELADALDRLYEDHALAEKMGHAGRQCMSDLGISWDNVLSKLLA
jgi:glycosyltransferase involved in cell wall biosynthesis